MSLVVPFSVASMSHHITCCSLATSQWVSLLMVCDCYQPFTQLVNGFSCPLPLIWHALCLLPCLCHAHAMPMPRSCHTCSFDAHNQRCLKWSRKPHCHWQLLSMWIFLLSLVLLTVIPDVSLMTWGCHIYCAPSSLIVTLAAPLTVTLLCHLLYPFL